MAKHKKSQSLTALRWQERHRQALRNRVLQEQRYRRRVQLAKQYIEQQFHTLSGAELRAALETERVAGHVGDVAAPRLASLFQRFEGMTLADYIKGRYLTRFAQLLFFTDLSPREITQSLGSSGLNASFVKTFGMKPREFRRMMRL